MRNAQGNVLFLILIAIALFAALAYVVTSSSRGSDGNINQEAEDMAISQVLQHFTSVKTAVQRLTLTGICNDYTIRYWQAGRINASNSTHYGDGSNTACQVFHPDGGGVPYMIRPEALDTTEPDEIAVINDRIYNIGTDASGSGSDQLIIVNVPRSACIKVNDKVGVPNPGGEPPAFTSPTWDKWKAPGNQYYTFPSAAYDGYHREVNYPGSTPVRAKEVAGHELACFSTLDSSSNTYYVLYQVLIAR